jgi:hypothetical protein
MDGHADEDLYQVAILIDQLKHDDVQFRVNASSNLTRIAAALGAERTREELVPFLCGAFSPPPTTPQWPVGAACIPCAAPFLLFCQLISNPFPRTRAHPPHTQRRRTTTTKF